jgi:hypothetical protein
MGYVVLIIGAIFGGAFCVGVEELFVIPHQVSVAKSVQYAADQRACDAKVALIQSTLAEHALAEVDERDLAIASMVPTPDERDGIKALCPKEKACRKP